MSLRVFTGEDLVRIEVHDGSRSATFGTALLEPSIHRPITDNAYAFAGLGFGLGYVANVGSVGKAACGSL